jgi:tetratricopeptide (TPR) repeat protein
MGVVFRARDAHTGASVALKVLHAGADAVRFEREARVLAELDHPGIVRYVAHGASGRGDGGERPWLAMEWLEGEDLETRLARQGLTVTETVVLGRRVAEALGVAHGLGVVHRDLKPANLFLVGREVARVKVLDFGIALGVGAGMTRATRTGLVIGTPGYMAPEQARGEPSVDARVDIFSLGCVLFECLTGRAAFTGEHVMAILAKILFQEAPRTSELQPGVPASLDELVACMLAKGREGRPADAGALARALEALGEPGPASGGVPVASGQESRSSLSGTEQRMVSVVVVAPPTAGDAVTLAVGEAHRGGGPAFPYDALLEVARRLGVAAEPMLDGSIVLLLSGMGEATDQAARAAACAVALCAAAPGARVALATGRAEVGELLPVGEAIDRVARLMGGARPPVAGVRIDEVTAGLLDDRFERFEDAAGMVLVGRREADAVRTLLGKPSPCVGRDAELAMLQALVAQCVDEPVARAMVVTAPAGAGKSRLRYELLRALRARTDAIDVWMARADPVGAGGAFAMAAQMVRRAAGLQEGEPLAVRQDKLRARVGRHVGPAAAGRVANFLGEMIGTPFSGEGNAQLLAARTDAILMGDQIRRAWEDLIDAESAAHPLLVVLEDLHWGDLPTVGLVDAALRLFPERPLMVLALARPEVDERFPGLWKERSVQRIALAPLPRKASERLVQSVLGAAVPAERVARLVEHAAGNAFYLEELIRSEAEGRGDELPQTVLAMVEGRLQALDPESRRLLRAASVFGQVFWGGGLCALAGGKDDRAATRRRIEDLVRCEVLTRRGASRFAGETEHAFRHAIVREAAYAMLTDEDRTLGHRLAAEWLEAVGEPDAMVLAEHLERGGEAARAVRAFARAAGQSLEGNDLPAALARAERGLHAGATGEAQGELRLVQAQAHYWRGENAEAARAAAEAMPLLPPGGDAWGDAAGEVAVAIVRLGDTDALVRLGGDLLDRLRTGEPSRGCLHGAARTAGILFHAGQYVLAQDLLGAATAIAGALPADALLRAWLLRARATQALQAGNPAEDLELVLAAAAAYEEAGALRNACAARVDAGYALLELGAFAEAERALQEGLASAERMTLTVTVWTAKQNLGWALYRQGRLEEAVLLERETAEAFRAQGDRRMEGGTRTYLAAALLAMGELAAAEREARAAVALLEVAPPLRPLALAALGLALLRTGRPAEALETLREAMAILDSLGSLEEGEALVRLVHAEALDAAGNRDEARHAIATAEGRLLARAAKITSARWRESFLENVPEHSRTLSLAAAWIGETA